MFSSNENSSLAGLLLTYALTLSDDIIDTMFALTSVETRYIVGRRETVALHMQSISKTFKNCIDR
jgi:hypothetical protein